ncbi:MAG: ATP-binding protein [Anaerolineae bacterium]|nr:ATP-binding protein [Anaerolineae bacterium]
MNDLDQLASFYLGKEYDLAAGRVLDRPVLYDARDLTTHAVCLGMTGSGKTGLGAVLLEEAALDGVPSLVIDPKGDMTNLLLTFPDLLPDDLRPWINPDDARRQNLEMDAYAAQTAERWRRGLADWGQDPDRIRRLKESADFVIYTPGSSAGRPMSILQTFQSPGLSWETDAELIRDRISSIVTALLALVGIQADPVRSREHILLSTILDQAWRAGADLNLTEIIVRVQKPPFSQLGVFPVETFFPERNRMELAMLLNGLMAAPSFADWTAGQPLDVDSLLHSSAGKPQVSIFYIAHLQEAERQFFVTLLLEQVVAWLYAQSGTTSLRALLYMDEMFGYLPPHPANPPTKKPLLTLLKQARAFGLGLMLTTQNPVDLDYKALANAGTWFIGTMQTERDKLRVLDGLEGAEAVGSRAGGASRADFDQLISALRTRVFLLHNVHAGQPVIFQTRWAMSYLRGPLTRSQIRELVGAPAPAQTPAELPLAAPLPAVEPQDAPAKALPAAPQPAIVPQVPSSLPLSLSPERPYGQVPPQLPSTVKQVFVPVQISLDEALYRLAGQQGWSSRSAVGLEGRLVYDPALIGLAVVRFAHARSRQTLEQALTYLLPVAEASGFVDWSQAQVQLDAGALVHKPGPGALFGRLPVDLGNASRFAALKKEFGEHLFYTQSVTIWYNPHLKLYSELGETAKAFQRRCREAARRARDDESEAIQARYKARLEQLIAKMQREKRELEEDQVEYSARKREEFFSGAESVLDFFTGRRMRRGVSTASRKRRLTQQAKADIEESEKAIDDFEDQIDQVGDSLEREMDDLTARWAALIDDVQQEEVRPRRSDVRVNLFGLAWLPGWEITVPGQSIPYQWPAYEASPM